MSRCEPAREDEFRLYDRRVQITVFLLFSVAGLLLIESALTQKALYWFDILIFFRVLMFLAALCGVWISLFSNISNLIATYCLVYMPIQAVFGILEGPRRIDFYQYVSYFLLLAMLSLNNSTRKWWRLAVPVMIGSLALPLFFKSPGYFASVGEFVYTFTTPVVVIIVAVTVARLNFGRLRAFKKVVQLRDELMSLQRQKAKRLEEALREAQEEVKQKAAFEATAQVAAQVAHDILSPVKALEVAATYSNDEVINMATVRIRAIVDELASQGRLAQGRSSGESVEQVIDPRSLLRSLVAEKKIQYKSRAGLEIIFCDDQRVSWFGIRAAPMELLRVLSNLINNSAEAIDSSGKVEVQLELAHENAVIEVRDNGAGIPPHVLPLLGTRGVSHGKPFGSGLGIYHAKKTVENFGGRLEIRSERGRGTRVCLQLPAILAN